MSLNALFHFFFNSNFYRAPNQHMWCAFVWVCSVSSSIHMHVTMNMCTQTNRMWSFWVCLETYRHMYVHMWKIYMLLIFPSFLSVPFLCGSSLASICGESLPNSRLISSPWNWLGVGALAVSTFHTSVMSGCLHTSIANVPSIE